MAKAARPHFSLSMPLQNTASFPPFVALLCAKCSSALLLMWLVNVSLSAGYMKTGEPKSKGLLLTKQAFHALYHAQVRSN